VEHGDDHRPGLGFCRDLAEMGEGGEQARHADREAGRRHRLAAESRDEAVITPAAADRAEAHRLAIVAGGGEGEFDLVDGAGVVLEAADDGGVDNDATIEIAGSLCQNIDISQLTQALLTCWSELNSILKPLECIVALKLRMLNGISSI